MELDNPVPKRSHEETLQMLRQMVIDTEASTQRLKELLVWFREQTGIKE